MARGAKNKPHAVKRKAAHPPGKTKASLREKKNGRARGARKGHTVKSKTRATRSPGKQVLWGKVSDPLLLTLLEPER
jgi:hypothetical protein